MRPTIFLHITVRQILPGIRIAGNRQRLIRFHTSGFRKSLKTTKNHIRPPLPDRLDKPLQILRRNHIIIIDKTDIIETAGLLNQRQSRIP